MLRLPWEITREMFLSEKEVDRLLSHLDERVSKATHGDLVAAETDRVIVVTLLFSGIRTTEFCSLLVSDFVTTSKESSLIVRGRTKAGRTVFLPGRVAQLVRRYIAETRPAFLPDEISRRDTKQALVFNEHRRPYERTALYRRVVRILTEAGLGARASVQLLRHTYGYLAYLKTGGNLLFVQRQLGHAHPMITSIYAQFVDESYADLADMLGSKAKSR